MNDRTTSTATVYAWAAWTLTAVVLAQAWLAFLLGYRDVGILLGCTAGVLSAAAATLHVRSFAGRVLRVIRMVSQIEDGVDRGAAPRLGAVRQMRR